MYKCFVKYLIAVLGIVCLFSCSPANNKPILIRFSPDSTSVVFSGIDPAGLLQVRNTVGIDTGYKEILSVLQTPAEDDSTSMELPFPGKVEVNDSTVIFKPAAPFAAGRSYLVISFMNVKFGNTSAALTGKLNYSVKPNQVILKR